MDGPQRASAWVWATQVDRDPVLKRSPLDLKGITGCGTFLGSRFPTIRLSKKANDRPRSPHPHRAIVGPESWTLADKGRRNASVSESAGGGGDLPPAGAGAVTMATADTVGAHFDPRRITQGPRNETFPYA